MNSGLKAQSSQEYLRLQELLTVVPFSSSTVWRKSRDGTFVRPRKLSSRITVWKRAEVEQWLESQGVL